MNKNKSELEVLRHSTSHVMAQAVTELFPGTKLAIGPAIEEGFYYDFDKKEFKAPSSSQAYIDERNLYFSLVFPLHSGLYKSSLNLYYKQYLYAVNGEKSYQIISANMNQSVAKQISLEAAYLFLPRYLIRYYQDPIASSTHFIGCTFAEHLFTFGLSYKLQNIQIKPYGRFEIDRYKENFSFYNGHAIRYGMDLNWSIGSLANLNLGVDRKQNSAKGPLPDISYDDNAVSVQILTRVLNLDKLYFNLGADYTKRFYTTENSASIDPFHRDRIDTKFSFAGGLEYRLSKNLRLNLEYNREIRKVSSPNLSNIDDIKNYNNNKLTLGLRFNLSKLTGGD